MPTSAPTQTHAQTNTHTRKLTRTPFLKSGGRGKGAAIRLTVNGALERIKMANASCPY